MERKAHVDASGLCGHSVGPLYPWSVVGVGHTIGQVNWQAWNLVTGHKLPERTAYNHAEADCRRMIERSKVVGLMLHGPAWLN